MTKHAQAVDAAIEAKEELVANLRRVIADAEELLEATVDVSGTGIKELRERTRENLTQARERLADVDAAVRASARRAAEAADEYVHDNPWPSIGMAAAAGLLLGVLLNRR